MKGFIYVCLCFSILLTSSSIAFSQSVETRSKRDQISIEKIIEICVPYFNNRKSFIWRFFFETEEIKDICSILLNGDDNSIMEQYLTEMEKYLMRK